MRKILVIEDDEEISRLLVQVLELENYVVEVAFDGAKGLEKLEASKPHGIIVDLVMPVMDGLTFIKNKNKNPLWKSIPVLLMTAQSAVEADQQMLSITNILKKPLTIDTVLREVKKALDLHP